MSDVTDTKPQGTVLPKIAFAVPAVALPLALLLGTVMNLGLPEPSRTVLPQVKTEELETVRVRRMYLPIIRPLEVTLPDVNKALGINLAVAVPATLDAELRKTLSQDADAVLAPLPNVVLDVWATMGPERDVVMFRRSLPPLLAHAMNARLRELGLASDDPVLEVLFMEFNMAH